MNIHHYEGIEGCKCICGLDIIKEDDRTIVILSELPDNTGTSVTKWYENIATRLYKQWLRGKYSIKNITWIEHHPSKKEGVVDEDTWDEVKMRWNWLRFKEPTRVRINPDRLGTMGIVV